MNLSSVLKASKGIPVDDFFALMWGQKIALRYETAEISGALPLTFRADGSALVDYRIWGNVGGAGDRTANLFDENATDTNNGFRKKKYIYPNGTEDSSVNWNISEYIDISGLSNITIKNANTDAPNPSVAFYDNNYTYISSVSYNRQKTINAQVPNNAKFCRISVRVANMNIAMLTPGTTPPETFVPFGYKLDISTSDGTNATTTPIYIGDEPLDKDEYVDYAAQKVYRMINGVLTTTDPPVPLPALPTCDGTTVIEYAGQSAEPSEMYIKYKKG